MSSLKDLASLIMVPSLVKDGRLDTVKPLGNSIIHPDATGNNDGTDGSTPAEGNFTFSRGSNLAATRVDVNGLIEKGRENVLTYSNDLNNGVWNHTDVSSTGGQSGYDGSNDAWLLNSSSGSNSLRRNISVSGINTFSIYAKAGTGNGIRIRFDQDTDCNAYIDLTDGSVFTEGNTLSINVYSISGGWYRISVAMNNIGLNLFRLIVTDGTTTTTAGTIYIQDAQLEQGLVATDYIETGASTAQAGILEDLPRLDYSGGASCPSLLLEPQRSNLVTQSEYYEDWTLAQSSVSLTSNASISPEGLQNATEIVWSDNIATQFFQYISAVSGTIYTTSAFVKYKSGTERSMNVGVYDAGHKFITITFNTDGTIASTSTSGTLVDSGYENYGNGWYRVYIIYTGGTTGTIEAQMNRLGLANTTEEFYIYGSQFEAGSYPTSYIPTMGSAVTRSADSCLATGVSDLIGQTEGALFAEFTYEGNVSGSFEISPLYIGTGTYATAIYIDIYHGNIYAVLFNNGVNQASINGGSLSVGHHKVAIGYANNDVVLYLDGIQLGSDTSATIPFCDRAYLGVVGTSTQLQKYQQHQAILFKTRLSNEELASLTTI
jgi:hypothetical protein